MLSLIAVLNLLLAGCDKEVNWETFPQIKSIATWGGGEHAWLVTLKGDLLTTEDGGKTWKSTPAATIGGFQSVTMLDGTRGFAVNNRGKIWSTLDGGQRWSAKSQLEANEWHFNESNQIHFTDDLNGWIVEALSVWRTADAGTNWRKVFSPIDFGGKGQPVRAFFLDMHQVWVCGTNGEVYSTKDSGQTWTIQTLSGKNTDFRDVFFTDERMGWLVGYTGGLLGAKLYHTSDGGNTWQFRPNAVSRGYLNSIYFINEKEGWACGHLLSDQANPNSEKAILMHTSDGGKTWQSTFTTGDPFFDRIRFLDQRQGWLFARDSVYRTDDGGKTWQIMLKLPPIKGG